MEEKKNAFFNFLIKNRWLMIIIFAVLSIAGIVMFFNTKVVYDLSSFAPRNSNTSDAVAVLKTEFDDKGSFYLMVKDISEEEAGNLQEELSEMDGVAVVAFDKSKDYINNSAFFTISLTDYDSTNEANDTISSIAEKMESAEFYMSGQSALSYYTRLETIESILKVGIIILVAILMMLVLTSKTFFELIVLLLTFGVAVILNMGTNFLFNGISYISHLVGLILQLALSLDYSIILLHRFMEERAIYDAKTAVINALKKGTPEILSSSLTTIAGLCALLVMTLPIGVEMGLSLAKSIVFSLLAVMFFMPALLVIFDKQLQKTKHKNFVPSVVRPAKAILKFRTPISIAFLIILVLAGTGQFFNEYSYNINGAKRILDSQDHIAEDFGYKNDLAIVIPKGDYEKEKALIEFMKSKEIITDVTGLSSIEVTDGLYLTDMVTVQSLSGLDIGIPLTEGMLTSLFQMYIDEKDPTTEISAEEYPVMFIDLMQVASAKISEVFPGIEDTDYGKQLEQLSMARANFEGETYSRIMFNINSPTESKESLALIDDLTTELSVFYEEYYMAGESVACYDMAKVFPKDNLLISLLTVLFVLLILFFTFKNAFLPVLLILVIQGGVWINFVIPFLSSTPVSFIGYLLVCAIQMGATIDYGIVLTNRYRSTKHLYLTKIEAMAEAENAVFPTIITSGSILTISGLSMGLVASGVVSTMGMLLGIGAATSVMLVLFVLPSLLLVLDRLIDKADYKNIFKKKPKNIL